MDFYATLSRYYNEVFPANADEMRFVDSFFKGKTRLLDIGCGNGNKTVFLARPDREVLGVDNDAGMVAAARAEHTAEGVSYEVMVMQDLGSGLKGRQFDGVLCLGNTLVHLKDSVAVEALLDDIYALMSPRGVCVLQILHYEWIIKEKITTLPLVDTPHVTFKRNYEWAGPELHFKTTLTEKAGGREMYGDIVLLPLLTADLAAMLQKQGFSNIRHYGDFHGGPLKPDSLASIIVCQK